MKAKQWVKKATHLIPDSLYIKLKYWIRTGKRLNLKNPVGFNEKLQWLKLYDRKSEYTTMADKYEAKKLVAERIGEEFVVSNLGVWTNFDDIDFDSLPEQFVLKCTHDSGGLVICKDKKQFDKAAAKKKIEECLKTNYYWHAREWPYKNIKPRILAEQYLSDVDKGGLPDYKFFCFNGVPKLMFIASERQEEDRETKFDFFDMEFNHLPIINGHPNADQPPEYPKGFEQMKKLAAEMSRGIPHLRVDFYECDGRLYLGELTFFHWSGFVPFEPEEWDTILGSWIQLPNAK